MIKDMHGWLWEPHPDTEGCVHAFCLLRLKFTRQDLKGEENWTQDFLHRSRSPNNPVWQGWRKKQQIITTARVTHWRDIFPELCTRLPVQVGMQWWKSYPVFSLWLDYLGAFFKYTLWKSYSHPIPYCPRKPEQCNPSCSETSFRLSSFQTEILLHKRVTCLTRFCVIDGDFPKTVKTQGIS